jgi:hypothetical protein
MAVFGNVNRKTDDMMVAYQNSSVVNLLVILQAGNALLMSSIGHSRLVVEALSG